MSDARRAGLDRTSSAFTWIFLAEVLLKLLGLGAAGFLSEGMNVFDAAVVALSLVDTFASVSAPRRPACCPCAGMSPAFAHALDVASNVLTVAFLAELLLKLLGLGTWGFLSDAFNVFDAVVVATGLLELGLTVGAGGRTKRPLPQATYCSSSHCPSNFHNF